MPRFGVVVTCEVVQFLEIEAENENKVAGIIASGDTNWIQRASKAPDAMIESIAIDVGRMATDTAALYDTGADATQLKFSRQSVKFSKEEMRDIAQEYAELSALDNDPDPDSDPTSIFEIEEGYTVAAGNPGVHQNPDGFSDVGNQVPDSPAPGTPEK